MAAGPRVVEGNAADGAGERGWFLGHFLAVEDARSTAALEAKWGGHPRGYARPWWSANRAGTTLCILVCGRYRLRFPDREVVLAREADYALWGPGVPHHAEAEAASVC